MDDPGRSILYLRIVEQGLFHHGFASGGVTGK